MKILIKTISLTIMLSSGILFGENIFINNSPSSLIDDRSVVYENSKGNKIVTGSNRDFPMQDGWPITYDFGLLKPMNVFDITGDGNKEILFTAGEYIYVLNQDGTNTTGWPIGESNYNDASGPVVGDIDNDGEVEIAAQLYSENLFALEIDATVLPNFPFNWETNASSTFGNTLVLAKIDDDDSKDMIISFGTHWDGSAFVEGSIHCINSTGDEIDGWPYIIEDGLQCLNLNVNDIDNDGENEIVATGLKNGIGKVFAFERDGTMIDGWPKVYSNWSMWISMADIDNDDDLEIFVTSLDKHLYVYHHDGTEVDGFPVSVDQMAWGYPVIGDLDGDDDFEIIFAGASKYYAYHHTGGSVDNWPISSSNGNANQFPVMADLDFDGDSEIFLSFGNEISAYDGITGAILDGWPVTLNDRVSAPLTISDIDNDGDMELIANSAYPGNTLYVWDLDYTYNEDAVFWGQFARDPEHRAKYVKPDYVDIESNYELGITNYELKQNYPNPFNPITKINYTSTSLSVNQLIEIVVYNSVGQQVWSSSVTDHALRVTGSILFDGSKYNSGIYYYSLVVDGKKMDTKSMVLIK